MPDPNQADPSQSPPPAQQVQPPPPEQVPKTPPPPRQRQAQAPAQAPPTAPTPQQAIVVDAEQFAQAMAKAQKQMQEQAQQLTATEGLDTTVPMGAYKVGARWLNAHGQEIEEPAWDDPEALQQPARLAQKK